MNMLDFFSQYSPDETALWLRVFGLMSLLVGIVVVLGLLGKHGHRPGGSAAKLHVHKKK